MNQYRNGINKLENCVKTNENTMNIVGEIESALIDQRKVIDSIEGHDTKIQLLTSQGNNRLFVIEKNNKRDNIIKGLILLILFGIIIMLIVLLSKK
jgi:hypothetical protein